MENEHQKNNIQKIIQLPAQEEALKHHQVRERSVWIQKALKYNQKNEKGNLKEYCKNLKNNKITVSYEMKKFGDFLIENKKLVEYTGNSEIVKIPNGVKVIGEGAFAGETNIKKSRL